jgi:hypothetical protein
MNCVMLKLLKMVSFDLCRMCNYSYAYVCSETVLKADLWESLIKFMEMACVGDFELRLKMIKSFHVEMITVESTVFAWQCPNKYILLPQKRSCLICLGIFTTIMRNFL